MTRKELAQQSGCSESYLRKLEQESLLPQPIGGGKGRGNAAVYLDSEATLHRLQLIEISKQPIPKGLGLYHIEELKAWWGTVQEESLDLAFLPAIAAIFEVPGYSWEDARCAGLSWIAQFQNEIGIQAGQSSIKQMETINQYLNQEIPFEVQQSNFYDLFLVALGYPSYQNQEIYGIVGFDDDVKPDALAGQLWETMGLPSTGIFSNYGAETFAEGAQVCNAIELEKSVAHASIQTLSSAAWMTRIEFPFYKKILRNDNQPLIVYLLHLWAIRVSYLDHFPDMEMNIRQFQSILPTGALDLMANVCEWILDDCFNETGQRMIREPSDENVISLLSSVKDKCKEAGIQ